MTERPILFSGSMVRAIRASQKTQTRRVIRPQPTPDFPYCEGVDDSEQWHFTSVPPREMMLRLRLSQVRRCPYGVPGDRLWVRERIWERPERTPRMMREGADTWAPWEYDADLDDSDREQLREWGWRSRPSIHMPRAACRLILDVVSIRVERLQSISEEDARSEGVCTTPEWSGYLTARGAFAYLWEKINGRRAPWDSDPWVWVVEFRKLEAPR
ncbi:MAG: hypothetical protein WC713_04290 [Candidatus Methylomirabilota bacterium]